MSLFSFAGARAPALLAALCALSPVSALADEAPSSETVLVLGRRTPPSQEAAAQALADVPGGVDLVPFEAFENRLSVSFADTLRLSPGVIADPRFAEEVRLSIRGSGLSRGFHMRGLALRLDGVPINLSDGAGDFQEIDPLSAQRIEVYRGANGLAYGAASLGGAINVATPTGRDVDAPFSVRVETGSFETRRVNTRFGGEAGAFDLFGSATYTNADGFRDHLETQSLKAAFNGGWRNALGETRATLSLNEINQHLPGSLTLAQALNTPEMASAASVSGDQARDIRSARGSLSHRMEVAGAHAQIGAWGFSKSLYHPIFQVVDQDNFDWGLFARLEDEGEGLLRRWALGVEASRGDNNAQQFVNVAGGEGALTFDAAQDAKTITLYGEAELGFTGSLSAIVGAQALRTERNYRRTFPTLLDASREFDGVSPKIGLLWRPSETITWYANVSKSFEPPTYSELVQTNVIQPVRAQEAWTGEVGARGALGAVVFDVALYRAQIDGEMLQYSVGPDFPAATFNAEDTVHQGVEAFAEWRALDLDRGALTLAASYTYSDFFFEDDAQFGDNDLAGAPKHQIHVEATWRSASGWFISPNLNWIPEDVVVDYANTTTAPSYAVWGVSAGLDVGERARIFVDARNLTDETYIATFSTATIATSTSALYYPGEGRALYAGVTLRFGVSP